MRLSVYEAGLLAVSVMTGAAAVVSGGCATDSGQPWGEISMRGVAQLDVPIDRVSEDGTIRTSRDFAWELESLELRVTSLGLRAAAAGGASFDPADPPAGYSLCHNGHCHADDGRLVDYDDIAVELGAAPDAAPLAVVSVEEPIDLGSDPQSLRLGACVGCEVLSPVRVAAAEVLLERVELVGVARDLTDRGRTPETGTRIELSVELDLRVTVPTNFSFGKEDALRADVGYELALPISLLDPIDPTATPEENAEALAEHLGERAELSLEMSRED